jgi:hypothetical protein
MAIKFGQFAQAGDFVLEAAYTKLKADEPWEWKVIQLNHVQRATGFAATLDDAKIAAARVVAVASDALAWRDKGPEIHAER